VLLFGGTVNEPATVTVAGQPATVTSQNAFSGPATVPSGTSQVVVHATDPSGNLRTNTYEVSQSGTPTAFTYDANGNMTGDGTKTYEWDAENRLTLVCTGACQAGTDPPNMLARFTYDGNGRRASKVAGGVTTNYVYDGGQFLEERLSPGSTKRYVYGRGIDQTLAQVVGGTTTYSVADHLGSIVRTTDSLGAPTLTRQYDPWGNLIQGSTTGGYAFTGREWDAEAALYYYRARYYDPKTGRFISADPAGLGVDRNLYAYVGNSPVTASDPLGLASLKEIDKVAMKRMREIYPKCQQLKGKQELCGPVCECKDGTFVAEAPVPHISGEEFPLCGSGKTIGFYHCHTKYSDWPERFSTDDNATIVFFHYVGYLVTPSRGMYRQTGYTDTTLIGVVWPP